MKSFKQYNRPTSGDYKKASEELTKRFEEIDREFKVEEFLHVLDEDVLNEKLITFGGQAYPKAGQVLILAGGAGCFVGDTLVKTIGGYKRISEISLDDSVLSLNEESGNMEYKQVVNLFKYEPEQSDTLLELEFDNGEIVRCTENHKFYVDGIWVKAIDLDVRRNVINKEQVYDIEVEDNHNYVITKSDIIVHNSGKGFTLSNLIGMEGKTFDVDHLKELVIKSTQIAKRILQTTGIDVKELNLRDPEDVRTLHYALSDPQFEYPKKEQKQLFDTLTTIAYSPDEKKPNLIFDVTLEKLSKFSTICAKVQDIGYKKENIHIVWVLTDIKVALEQNKNRKRVVPEDILIQTHEGASMTMKKLVTQVDMLRKNMDGDIWISANVTGVDSKVVKSDKGGSYVSEANYFLIKKKGQAPSSIDDMAKMFVAGTSLLSKIKTYTPKINQW
jgi:predicted kinase